MFQLQADITEEILFRPTSLLLVCLGKRMVKGARLSPVKSLYAHC